MADEASILLFSYGTLQQPGVQTATFGRLLGGEPDVLPGCTKVPLTITDVAVIAISGAAIHTVARHAGNPTDLIEGVVFSITAAELGPPMLMR